MSATPCETCDHVHPAAIDKSPHYWTCLKFPRLEGMNAVAPTVWAGRDPYNRCTSINLGFCPLWTERRKPNPATDNRPEGRNPKGT
jgi:hypothetical protein